VPRVLAGGSDLARGVVAREGAMRAGRRAGSDPGARSRTEIAATGSPPYFSPNSPLGIFIDRISCMMTATKASPLIFPSWVCCCNVEARAIGIA
jgi:hypothetical protein